MTNYDKIISSVKETIKIESKAIANLSEFIDNQFAEAVTYIYNSNGRVIITGIGKSANIAQKIVATLNSTGTPAIFMHAADAIHGDLGIIQENDVVICISKSGNTPEIKVLVPLIKNTNNKVIALTSNTDSFLANQADYVLNAYVEKEACPNNLAPTTSTTAQLVIGDALAIALLNLKNFSSKDFAKYHPGGALGKKLYLRVHDIVGKNECPKVTKDASLKDVIIEISAKRLGATAVVEGDKVIGVITDGDLRRMLAKSQDISTITAVDIMTKSPKTIASDVLAIEALDVLESHGITQLLVEDNGQYKGVIHLHDLIKEGII